MGLYARQNVHDMNVLTGEMWLRFRPPTRTSEKLESVDSEATLEAEMRLLTSTVWMNLSPKGVQRIDWVITILSSHIRQ